MFKLPMIFVTPGEGVKVPLPVPGEGLVPAAGKYVPRTMAVERLLRTKDLVESEPPAAEQAPAAATMPAAAKIDAPAPAVVADTEKKKG